MPPAGALAARHVCAGKGMHARPGPPAGKRAQPAALQACARLGAVQPVEGLAHAQVYAAPSRREPRVKASQCFTKYKWRDTAAALRETGPQIVATQARHPRPLHAHCMF